MDTQMLGSGTFDAYKDLSQATGVQPNPGPNPMVAPLYFISFIFFGTMIMLNLFIGIIVGSMAEAQEESAKLLLKKDQSEGQAKSYEDDLRNLEASMDDVKLLITNLRLRLENAAEARAEAALYAEAPRRKAG